MFNHILKISIILAFIFASNTVIAISQNEARHLLTRTGFGASMEDIKAYSKLNYDQAVDQLLNQVNSELVVSPPLWLFNSPKFDRKRMKDLSVEQRKALRREQKMKEFELKGWWVAEMANTESPLTEKMVLFWHNHFTSSLQKVKQPVLLYRQNELFRKHALGNYKALAHAISKDPAMLGYLDNFKSSKQSPNENFARELLELFTLGEGNYSEKDIKEAARAFTGWSVDRKTGEYKFRKRMHDFGEKEFFTKRGKLDGNDIIEIVFQQPEVATLLVNKLWLEFISETPDQAEIERLAAILRTNDYEMKSLMRELLMSNAFRDRANYAHLIKSPLDFIVGTLRMLNVPVEDGRIAAFASALLGQNVFDPPNVKGWPGGEAWITSSSILTRQQLLERMFRGNAAENTQQQKQMDRRLNMQKMFNRENQKVDLRPYLESLSAEYSKQEVLELLLADEPVDSSLVNNSKKTFNTNELLALMSDPVYQLK
jgi:uncharacterized protein (DUF1800 family)